MVDYSIDGSFDIKKDDYGGLVEVSELEEFEQELIVDVHYKLVDIVQSSQGTIEEKITLMATRLARQKDVIDQVTEISVSKPKTSDTVAVEISYTTGRTFEETL
jgi:hypothetical protein